MIESHLSRTSGVTSATAAVTSRVAETLAGVVITAVLLIVLIRVSRGALVSDVGVEAGPPVRGVGDDLRPAVRQLHPVFTTYGLAIARFSPAKVVACGLVLDRVAELVGFRLEETKEPRELLSMLYRANQEREGMQQGASVPTQYLFRRWQAFLLPSAG